MLCKIYDISEIFGGVYLERYLLDRPFSSSKRNSVAPWDRSHANRSVQHKVLFNLFPLIPFLSFGPSAVLRGSFPFLEHYPCDKVRQIYYWVDESIYSKNNLVAQLAVMLP